MKKDYTKFTAIYMITHMVSIGLIIIKLVGGLTNLSWVIACLPFIFDLVTALVLIIALAAIHTMHK